jgi:tRNA(fMet)-specific endonuclease VapC
MIVVDTNLLDVLIRRDDRSERLARRLATATSEHPVATTIVNIQEKVDGWLSRIKAHNAKPLEQPQYYAKLHDLTDFFSGWRILPFDQAAAAEFVRLRKQSLGVKPMDLRIASIALLHRALVVTQDWDDFQRVPGLRVEDWFPYSE